MPNASLLRHPRPIWRGGRTGSAKGGLVAVTAVDHDTGDATLNLFGLQKCHDRTCDHPVFEWSDTNLLPFQDNPLLGGGSTAAYGTPAALPVGGGGIGDVEMLLGPDGLLHAIGCGASNALAPLQCHHYVNGGPAEVGATVGVQWYGPVGSSDDQSFPRIAWLRGAVAVVEGEDAGGYPGAEAPTHFLHAQDGKIRRATVSWEPVGVALPGVFDARHVHLALAEQSEDAPHAVSMTVMWATWNRTEASVVEFGKKTDTDTATATGTSYSFAMVADNCPKCPPSHKKPPGSSLFQYEHVVSLTGLEPGTRYRYRPGAGANGSSFSNQSWREFVAPHPVGSDATAFFVLADMGADEADGGQTTAAMAAELSSPQFLPQGVDYQTVLHAGDLAYNMETDEGRVGDRFMEQIEPVASRVPYMVSPGNHESHGNFCERAQPLDCSCKRALC